MTSLDTQLQGNPCSLQGRGKVFQLALQSTMHFVVLGKDFAKVKSGNRKEEGITNVQLMEKQKNVYKKQGRYNWKGRNSKEKLIFRIS